MNQSNKKNLEFIMNSGINYFLQDSPKIWFDGVSNSSSSTIEYENEDKTNKIQNIIKKIHSHDSQLKKVLKI